jgi:hypothetical protein
MSRLLENSEGYRENQLVKNEYNNEDYYNDQDDSNLNSINVEGKNFNIDEYRKKILSRNIYTPINNEYQIENPKLIESINSISGNMMSYINVTAVSKVTNSIERLYARINNPTKLVKIGMLKLADQFLKTTASNASRLISEQVNLSNVFKKDKSIFENRDYSITKRDLNDYIKSLTNNTIGNLIDNLISFNVVEQPLNKNFNNSEYLNYSRDKYYLNNTGKALVNILKIDLGQNQYILSYIPEVISDLNNKQYFLNKTHFTINNYIVDPYIGNELMELSNTSNDNIIREYDSSFINEFGKTNLYEKIEDWDDTNYINNDIEKEFVWGDNISNFNIERGLLKYTNALMEASERNLIFNDKKKVFDPKNKDKFIGYNGAGIHDVPEESLNINPNLYDGIRQHNLSDQYNKFVKAIRFNGNRIYGGNKNSVVYDTIQPKIHPVRDDDGNIDNRNMMFSIENLAINIKHSDIDKNLCYIDDEYNTPLPLSERGQFNGRIMWFPPYDLKLREDSTNNLTNTEFIGRGEPIYTYNNTERSATISFKLLIDTPPQLREIPRDNFHRRASEFFLFGGDYDLTFNKLSELEKELDRINEELSGYEETVNVIEPPFEEQIIKYYFDNDSSTIIDTYEDNITQPDKGELNDFGLNLPFYNGINDFINSFLTEEYKDFIKIELIGNTSLLYIDPNKEDDYNTKLSNERINNLYNYICNIYGGDIESDGFDVKRRGVGSENAVKPNDPTIIHTRDVKRERNVEIRISKNENIKVVDVPLSDQRKKEKFKLINERDDVMSEISLIEQRIKHINTNEFKTLTIEDNYLKQFDWAKDKVLRPCFFSQTPEDFHRRLTFLQQCMRQGRNINTNENTNSVFGRQPVCVLRIGDFYHTKIMIENMAIDYSVDNAWDLNPEGMGVQPMIADVDIKVKVIGGQSLATPIAELQNAISFNYYANSTYYNDGIYKTPTNAEVAQLRDNNINNNDA